MNNASILWVDDEIELLKPHIIFLEQKGYNVETANSGVEAIDLLKTRDVDIIFLDENMPGLSGIETLSIIKNQFPGTPVVMITKSEEEHIMDEAIGSNIRDFLIKPVNPNQILLCLKKNLENKKLISQKTSNDYQQEFRNIGMEISNNLNHEEWKEIYKKLVYWELELNKSNDNSMQEILSLQKAEANMVFSKFIERNYIDWVKGKTDNKPTLSHTLIREKVFPLLGLEQPLYLLLIDNLRYDQWKSIQPVIEELFRIERDELYYTILPTTTQYARNALFSGLLPSEIEKKYPQYWINEDEEGTKNQFESELMGEYLKRFGKDIRYSYNKVLNLNAGKKLVENLPNLSDNKLNIIVYNFVDMLSHARTEMEVIRELAEDESAYRSLTLSWFEHSPLLEILRFIASKKANLVITTDHGSVRVQNPVKVIGDRNTNTNLRYKTGRSLQFDKKEVFEVPKPEDALLPKQNMSSSYIFCKKNDFFAYPNNYNYYVSYYRNTFQHGGISMEEVLVPFISLKAK